MSVKRDLKDELNRCMPAAAHAKLGDLIDELIAKHNAVLARMDAAGAGSGDVTKLDDDNVALYGVKPLGQR